LFLQQQLGPLEGNGDCLSDFWFVADSLVSIAHTGLL